MSRICSHYGAQLNRPTVSAIVPAYNSSATIRETLRSIYDQTYPHIIEVIVVDDGSTDDTPAIIAREFPDVILIRQENAGGAAARNTGARAATGAYLALLDHDDQWLPHKIATQVEAMETSQEIALLTCEEVRIAPGSASDADIPRSGTPPIVRKLGLGEIMQRSLPAGITFSASGWLLRRQVFMAQGGLDPTAWPADDWEFFVRLVGQGYSVAALLVPLYRYYLSSESASHCPSGWREILLRKPEIIRRYDPSGSGWQSRILAPEEYRRTLHDSYWGDAWYGWRLGEYDLARDYLREARKLAPAGLVSSLRHHLAAWQPGLYRALSRARARQS